MKGIRKIRPGEYLRVTKKNIQVHRYYDLEKDSSVHVAKDYTGRQQELRDLLSESVRKRLVSDVPLGTFLSGGIDSSIITHLAKAEKDDLESYAITYPDEPFFDESNYSSMVANHLGTNHTEIPIRSRQLVDNIEAILQKHTEPFADSSALPVHLLCEKTRQHVKVILSGDGADELFAGYNKYKAFLMLQEDTSSVRVARLAKQVLGFLPRSRKSKVGNLMRQMDRLADASKLEGPNRYWFLSSFLAADKATALLSDEMRSQLVTQKLSLVKQENTRFVQSDPSINGVLKNDQWLVLPGDMLMKVDMMSMAHGLEVRVPFMDHTVVEYANALGVDDKINSSLKKRILQDAFRGDLPDKLYNRSKHGFEVPIAKWLTAELRPMMEELLDDARIREQGVFNAEHVSRLKKKLLSSNPGDAHATIWAIMVFQYWMKGKNIKVGTAE
jgi:asparagine synthase (glutamine-hydrolysing)